jgi:hypothetical protein
LNKLIGIVIKSLTLKKANTEDPEKIKPAIINFENRLQKIANNNDTFPNTLTNQICERLLEGFVNILG